MKSISSTLQLANLLLKILLVTWLCYQYNYFNCVIVILLLFVNHYFKRKGNEPGSLTWLYYHSVLVGIRIRDHEQSTLLLDHRFHFYQLTLNYKMKMFQILTNISDREFLNDNLDIDLPVSTKETQVKILKKFFCLYQFYLV